MRNIVNVLVYMVLLFAMYFTFGQTGKFLFSCAENPDVSILTIIGGFLALVGVMTVLVFILMRTQDLIEITFKKNMKLENASEEFKNAYAILYKGNIGYLEKLRKKLMNNILVRNISIYVFVLTNIHLVIGFEFNNDVFIAALFICEASIFLIKNSFYKVKELNKKYTEIYKEVILEFLELVHSNLKYEPILETPKNVEEYAEAKFDGAIYNKQYEDDYIFGEIAPGIVAKIVNVITRYETDKVKETKFSGMFAYCSSKVDFKGNVIKININKKNKEFGAKNKKVQMDSSEFEKYFDVHSEDKVLAMRILTADIMEIILEFYNKYNLPFEIVYKNSNIYLRFFTGNIFEPQVWKSSLDEKTLYEYYEILRFIIDVTKKSYEIIKELEV